MNKRNEVPEIEKVIELLSQQGITIIKMAEKLGIERGHFYSQRQSTKKATRDSLAAKLVAVFPEEMAAPLAVSTTPSGIELKYIALIEKRNQELQDEIAEVRNQNRILLNEIRESLKELSSRI